MQGGRARAASVGHCQRGARHPLVTPRIISWRPASSRGARRLHWSRSALAASRWRGSPAVPRGAAPAAVGDSLPSDSSDSSAADAAAHAAWASRRGASDRCSDRSAAAARLQPMSWAGAHSAHYWGSLGPATRDPAPRICSPSDSCSCLGAALHRSSWPAPASAAFEPRSMQASSGDETAAGCLKGLQGLAAPHAAAAAVPAAHWQAARQRDRRRRRSPAAANSSQDRHTPAIARGCRFESPSARLPGSVQRRRRRAADCPGSSSSSSRMGSQSASSSQAARGAHSAASCRLVHRISRDQLRVVAGCIRRHLTHRICPS